MNNVFIKQTLFMSLFLLFSIDSHINHQQLVDESDRYPKAGPAPQGHAIIVLPTIHSISSAENKKLRKHAPLNNISNITGTAITQDGLISS